MARPFAENDSGAGGGKERFCRDGAALVIGLLVFEALFLLVLPVSFAQGHLVAGVALLHAGAMIVAGFHLKAKVHYYLLFPLGHEPGSSCSPPFAPAPPAASPGKAGPCNNRLSLVRGDE